MSYTGSVPDTLTRPNDWLAVAPCKANPDAMFDTTARGIESAKSICRGCSIVERCLQWALENREPYGTWGGLSEADRRRILRRRGMPLPAEEEEPPPPRTFQSLYDERTVPLGDGHLAWTGSTPVSCEGAYHTPTQIAFRVSRGRPAEGIVRRTCKQVGCVLPGHLTDQRERREQQEAAAEAEAIRKAAAERAGQKLAPCGTRSAYQRHARNKEPIDDACRAANTAAGGQYAHTGTTKVAV